MLNENEYLGFATKKADDETIVYAFEFLPEGVKRYGAYKMIDAVNSYTTMDKATVLSICVLDGTMPISMEEFDQRIRDGEGSDDRYNMFIRVNILGTVEFRDRQEKSALDSGDNTALRSMLYECVRCLKEVEVQEAKPKKTEKKVAKKAARKKAKQKGKK